MAKPRFDRWNTEVFLREACDAIALEIEWDSIDSGRLHHTSSAARTHDGTPILVAVIDNELAMPDVFEDLVAEREDANLSDAPLWLYVPHDMEMEPIGVPNVRICRIRSNMPAAKPERWRVAAFPRLRSIFDYLAIATSPLGFLTLLFWVNAFVNPMATAYIDAFEVRNATLQAIEVTPLGKSGGDQAELSVLPLCSRTRPVLPDLKAVRRLVAPGAATQIVYDGDDAVPVALVVESPNAAPRALGIVPLRNGRYLVSESTLLRNASPDEVRTIESWRASTWTLVSMFGGLVPAVIAALSLCFRHLPKPQTR
jgi:hypothetical protein